MQTFILKNNEDTSAQPIHKPKPDSWCTYCSRQNLFAAHAETIGL